MNIHSENCSFNSKKNFEMRKKLPFLDIKIQSFNSEN
jgi:hypothetical protein